MSAHRTLRQRLCTGRLETQCRSLVSVTQDTICEHETSFFTLKTPCRVNKTVVIGPRIQSNITLIDATAFEPCNEYEGSIERRGVYILCDTFASSPQNLHI